MIERLSDFWRSRLRAEIRLAHGRRLYVARYVDAIFDNGMPTAIGNVFATYLRTAHGTPVSPAVLAKLSLADRKAAFAAIAARHSQVQGVAILPACGRWCFLVAVGEADSDAALEALARRFVERHVAVNHALLTDLRAAASTLAA